MTSQKCRAKNPDACIDPNCPEKRGQKDTFTNLNQVFQAVKSPNTHLGSDKQRIKLAQEFEDEKDMKVLLQLANDENRTVLLELAENRTTPTEVLAILALNDDNAINYFLAKNPNTPANVIAQLCSSPREDIAYEAVRNINTPVETLAAIVNVENPDTAEINKIYYALHNPNITPELLEKAWLHRRHPSIYANAKTPAYILETTFDDTNPDLYSALAQNTGATPEMLNKLVQQDWYKDSLLSDGDGMLPSSIKAYVAMNPQVSAETLNLIANDENTFVQAYAVMSLNAPQELLQKTFDENPKDWNVLSGLATNANTPLPILKHIEKLDHWQTREEIAGNRGIDENMLLGYLISPDKKIRTAAYYNPAASKDLRIAAILAGSVKRDLEKEELWQASQKPDQTEYRNLLFEQQVYSYNNDF